MQMGAQGQVARTRLFPPQVAWSGDGTYLLVVLLGPQGCPHVLSRGRADGGAVLRAVVVALRMLKVESVGLLGWPGP